MEIFDYLILVGYALLILGVGAFYSRQNKTADDYLLGGRRMSPIALGFSLFATLVSTLSYLGNPGEMIAHGPMMVTQLAAHPLIFLIVGSSKDLGLPLTVSFVWIIPCSLLVGITVGSVASGLAWSIS